MIVKGQILKGRGIGRKIGFPTLNLVYDGDLCGVFSGKVFLNGNSYAAAVHLGSRPTFDDENLICEVYLLDYVENQEFSDEVEVHILDRIRDIKKFSNINELKKRIATDIEFVKMSLC